MECWKCGQALSVLKITFRTLCDQCNASQHCCKNCKFHAKGKPNECLVPGTELVVDREKMNFCEEYSPIGKKQEKSGPTPEDVSRRLFGES